MTIELLTKGGSKKKVEAFTSSGTFTLPPGVEVVEVLAVGGGGSGGSGTYASGGGGGEIVFAEVNVKGLVSVAVTIGAGGVGVSATSDGNDGNDTTFGSLLTAHKGEGGNASAASNEYGGNGGGSPMGAFSWKAQFEYEPFLTNAGEGGLPQAVNERRQGKSGIPISMGTFGSFGGGGGGGNETTQSPSGDGGDSPFDLGGHADGQKAGGGASYGAGTDGNNTGASSAAAANSGGGTGGGSTGSGNGGSGYLEVRY